MKLPIVFVPNFYNSIAILLLLIRSGVAIFCSQCNSQSDDGCEKRPPPASNCTSCLILTPNGCLEYQHYDYCIIIQKETNGTQDSFTRACSPISMGYKSCSPAEENGVPVRLCYATCQTDGCNSACAIQPTYFSQYLIISISAYLRNNFRT